MVAARLRPKPASVFTCCAHLAVWLALTGCSVRPSRAPLGGTYDAPPAAKTADRGPPKRAAPALSSTPNEDESETEPASTKPLAVAPEVTNAGAPLKPSDTLQYQPLKAGDRIQAEVTLEFEAELRGGPPGMPASGGVKMVSKLRVELKISKASARTLEALELTVTTLAMHTEFGGHGSDAKSEPPEVYDVTLGQSPSIRARDGSKPDAEERAVLLILVAPIAEFHAHWAASPPFALEPGWSSKVLVALPKFADAGNETIKVGPLAVRYSGRDARDLASGSVPFGLSLPVQYGADMGKLELELSGLATLSATSGRPMTIAVNGPFSAQGGAGAGPMSFLGRTKFTAQLSYP